MRREQQQVDEPVYENDFDSFDERDENSRIRQVLTNQISYLNTSQNAPHNVQINNTSVVNVNNNESSLNLNKILVIDVDNKLNENQSQIKEKSLPFIKSFVSKSKMVRSESIYYVCNQCNEFETENQEEMVKHLENNHEDFLNNMINVNH